jgi:hypothetical protein
MPSENLSLEGRNLAPATINIGALPITLACQ